MEDGDRGLLLFLRVVEWTWLESLGELFPPALSAAMMRAAMGDWPFWAASGGVVREWGDIVEGGEVKLGGGTGGIFRLSLGAGNHCCPSPLSLAAVPSPSGSGDAFLFMLRGCFPLSGGGKGLNTTVELQSSDRDQQLHWEGDEHFCCSLPHHRLQSKNNKHRNEGKYHLCHFNFIDAKIYLSSVRYCPTPGLQRVNKYQMKMKGAQNIVEF